MFTLDKSHLRKIAYAAAAGFCAGLLVLILFYFAKPKGSGLFFITFYSAQYHVVRTLTLFLLGSTLLWGSLFYWAVLRTSRSRIRIATLVIAYMAFLFAYYFQDIPNYLFEAGLKTDSSQPLEDIQVAASDTPAPAEGEQPAAPDAEAPELQGAENASMLEKLTSYPWFNGITQDQKVWLKSAVKDGLQYQLPVQAKFFSLSETLDIYKTAELNHILKTYPAIPSVIVYVGGEYSESDSTTNWGDITLHEFKSGRTGRVKITYKETTGWIKRSAISMHSIIITTQTGNYIRDIIPGYRAAGGSSARFTVESKNDSCYLVVRYNGNYRLKDEKYFGFHYDVRSNQLLDVLQWVPARVYSVKQKPLKELVTTRGIDKLKNQIGLGKTGFMKAVGGQSSGQLHKPKIFYGLIDEKTPTVRIGQYLVINSSHY